MGEWWLECVVECVMECVVVECVMECVVVECVIVMEYVVVGWVVGGVWDGVCGVWYVVCGGWWVVGGVWWAVWWAVCGVWCVVVGGWWVVKYPYYQKIQAADLRVLAILCYILQNNKISLLKFSVTLFIFY